MQASHWRSAEIFMFSKITLPTTKSNHLWSQHVMFSQIPECLVSNHETRIEQINKALPSNHTVGERLKETGGTLNGCSGWHLVPENWVSANSRARPLTSVRKQVQSSKVIVDNRLCSVHVRGNKSAHYTGTDVTCFQWSRRTWTGMGYESVSGWIMHCTYTTAMFTDSLQNFFVHCELAANLYHLLSSHPQTACKGRHVRLQHANEPQILRSSDTFPRMKCTTVLFLCGQTRWWYIIIHPVEVGVKVDLSSLNKVLLCWEIILQKTLCMILCIIAKSPLMVCVRNEYYFQLLPLQVLVHYV